MNSSPQHIRRQYYKLLYYFIIILICILYTVVELKKNKDGLWV